MVYVPAVLFLGGLVPALLCIGELRGRNRPARVRLWAALGSLTSLLAIVTSAIQHP